MIVTTAMALIALQASDPRDRQPRRVEIHRTEYGVPHILADDLEAMGFGLGYVQSEDYGASIAAAMAASRGILSRHLGAEELDADFVARETHARAVETFDLLDPRARQVYVGFAEGVNRYIRLHPDEYPSWVKPDFTGVDALARDVQTWSRGDAARVTARLGAGEAGRGRPGRDAGRTGRESADPLLDGSNAWAFHGSRTESGHAILLRNPHLPWDGEHDLLERPSGLTYYEAHVRVPGVIDFYGDFRIGTAFGIIGGFNPKLGWATTNNYPTLSQVYRLDMHPALEEHAVLDGRPLPLTRHDAVVDYRTDDGGTAVEMRTSWRTAHGPVIHRTDEHVYVLKDPRDGEFRRGEQFLRMMTAESLDEWLQVMRMRAHPTSNFTYADRDGNIAHYYNARLPLLPHPVTGDTAAHASSADDMWSELVPWEELPLYLNPPGGYVQQANDPPDYTNLGVPVDRDTMPANLPEPRLRLRSQLSLELAAGSGRVSLEDVIRLKHSPRMPTAERVMDDLLGAVREADEPSGAALTASPAGGDPVSAGRSALREAAEVLAAWDRTAAADSRGGVLFARWAAEYFGAVPDSLRWRQRWDPDRPVETPFGLGDPVAAEEALAAAAASLEREGIALDAPWGEVHRVVRGDVDVPVSGCPATLGCFRTLSFGPLEDGRRAADRGDAWVLAVEFGDVPRAYTVLAYGQTARPGSPHYADQAAMFARGEMKRVAWTDEDIRRATIRRYRPGDEVDSSGEPAPPSAAPPPMDPPPLDLATLFDLGHLVLDENGDGVPDRLAASLILAPDPDDAERAAAAEITARLGFETMALDLPLRRGPQPGRIGILVGDRAVKAAGLSRADFRADVQVPASPATGAATVATLTASSGERWLAVLGDEDDDLLRAARFLAGSLPHVRTLSGPSLSDVGDELSTWIGVGDPTAPAPAFTFHRATLYAPGDGVHLFADLAFDDDAGADTPASAAPATVAAPATQALDRLQILAWERLGDAATGPDSADLRFPGLATITVAAGARQVVLPTLAAQHSAGPTSSRPGAGAKNDLDLSNLYTTEGFLGGGDIPDRIDVVVVPGDGAEGVPELTARMGLEAAGLTVPLVKRPDEIGAAAREPTTVLVGHDHPLVAELADSGKIVPGDLPAGHGLIEVVPDAFGDKPSVVVTGADREGAANATRRLAEFFPFVGSREDGAPTFDDVEYELWGTLSGRTPAGQAAIGLYKLDRIVAGLAGEDIVGTEITVSVEKPPEGLGDYIRERAAGLGADEITVKIDNRDVQRAATIFDDTFAVPSEVDRFWSAFEARVLPGVVRGEPVRLHARLSEPPEVRRAVADEARLRLIDAGADPEATGVEVLSAFKQGFSWLRESVAPRLADKEIGQIVIEFRRNDPPDDWPQQAMHTPVRWLHEIFPIDEILASDLGVSLRQIRFEMTDGGPTYRVRAAAPDGSAVLEDTFDPVWVLRPYVDRFQDYEHVRVTTGWLTATAGRDTLAHERIVTDPEWFWDRFQARTLPAVYDYVMDRHDGNPRGGGTDAPFFGTLTVELELSEPDYRLGVDNEIISPMDALHEEIYFGAIEFFHLMGRNARGQDLTYPGRIIPVMRPKSDGAAGRGRATLTGFATDRPAVVVRYETRDGASGERRLDIPKIAMERPSLRRAVVAPGSPAYPRLDLRVRADSETDEREALLNMATPLQVDARMISAEQVAATIANLGALRDAGMYAAALAWDEVGEIAVRAEWTHEQDDSARMTTVLPANGTPPPLPAWTDLLPDGWSYAGERIVQWDTPIPPLEGHEMLAKMSRAFDRASMYEAGESYLGRTIWAMDLMPPVNATHWSRTKATTFKPTVIYSARQHANEVSSTSHVLRHAELLLADSAQRAKLDKVNVVIHPFTNPDGAQLAYDLYRITPDYILHAGYLGSLGMDATAGSGQDFPIYPESKVRGRLWERWLPDIFLNPHGYPSHQVVQLFSEYTGLVRRGRVTERNWGFNKGWFMPGFGYIDDPAFPRHKEAAFRIRDYITAGINSNRDVFEMNQRSYDRYRRYGAAFDPEVFRLPLTDSVLIEMPLKGSRGSGGGGGGFNPRITIWSGITEAPDETAYGPWLELVAKAGLSWDRAILDYLYDGEHEVERSGSAFRGGVTLKLARERPPARRNGPGT